MPDFNLQFPAFKPAEMDDAKQQRRIISYLKSLHEQLTYMLNNLDEENLSSGLTGAIDGKASAADAAATAEALDDTRKALLWTGAGSATVGAGSAWSTLGAFGQEINGRRLDDVVTLRLTGDLTGGATLDSLTGRGRLVIEGGGHTIAGDLTLTNITAPVIIRNARIEGTVRAADCRFIRLEGVTLTGASGRDYALYLDEGTTCHLDGCALYNAESLIEAHEGVTLTAHNLTGSGGNFLNGSHMIAMMSGTRPQGGAALTACLTAPATLTSLTASGG